MAKPRTRLHYISWFKIVNCKIWSDVYQKLPVLFYQNFSFISPKSKIFRVWSNLSFRLHVPRWRQGCVDDVVSAASGIVPDLVAGVAKTDWPVAVVARALAGEAESIPGWQGLFLFERKKITSDMCYFQQCHVNIRMPRQGNGQLYQTKIIVKIILSLRFRRTKGEQT